MLLLLDVPIEWPLSGAVVALAAAALFVADFLGDTLKTITVKARNFTTPVMVC